jgi:hypothetical protein
MKTIIFIMCGVLGIYEMTQAVRSLLKSPNVAILEDNKITFYLYVPPYSLVDTYQLVGGEILLDPSYGNIKSRFLRNVGTSIKQRGGTSRGVT